MKLPLSIAEKLILLHNGEKIPASKIRHPLINEMLDNSILKKQIRGRSKALIYLSEQKALTDFLQNHYGISDLQNYVDTLRNDDHLTRAEAVKISSNSKLKKIRTFKGFLVNCYSPIPAAVNGQSITLNPVEGTFQFIHDFEDFTIPQDITVVGVENPENFRHIARQKYLFEDVTPLFVSRYPQNQSKDLLKWLQSVPNKYLHFGDFDLAGIGIYLNEYKKHLADRAAFFDPENIENLISEYGNRELYSKQKINFDLQFIKEEALVRLVKIIQKHKKGLEQEVLMTLF
jgi:hypothetical protein